MESRRKPKRFRQPGYPRMYVLCVFLWCIPPFFCTWCACVVAFVLVGLLHRARSMPSCGYIFSLLFGYENSERCAFLRDSSLLYSYIRNRVSLSTRLPPPLPPSPLKRLKTCDQTRLPLDPPARSSPTSSSVATVTPHPQPTQKPGSVLISVYIYGHRIAWWQWIGVFCVYGGLALNVWTRYHSGGEKKKGNSLECEMETLTEPSAISLRPGGRRSPGGRGWGQSSRSGEGGGVVSTAASLAAQQNDQEDQALLLGGTRNAVGKNGRNNR